jgi:L-threonylcarbamoyladenylate synthase
MYQTVYQTYNLKTSRTDHLRLAAELLAAGEIIAFQFYGAFAFLGDADQAQAAAKIFQVKQRPLSQTLSLVCPPEYLHEHVDLQAVERFHAFEKIKTLYRNIHALGIIMPAAVPGAPTHLLQNGTIHNVWTEYPPLEPIRMLVNELRRQGKRALLGASANMSGEPTYKTAEHVLAVFQGRIAAVMADESATIPPNRKKSTTMLDLTAAYPRLHREGNVPEIELRAHLDQLGFRPLVVDEHVIKL